MNHDGARDRVTGALGALGVALMALFVVRLVAVVPVAIRLHRPVALRFDLAFCLALLLPASACVGRVRRFLARARGEGLASGYLAAAAAPPALVLGWAPGRFAPSLAAAVVLAIALAAVPGVVAGRAGGRARGLRTAWLVLSCFVLAGAWQCAATPWVIWVRAAILGP